MLGEDTQTLSFRGRRSRNKVSVGEPAEGSLSFLHPHPVCTAFRPFLRGYAGLRVPRGTQHGRSTFSGSAHCCGGLLSSAVRVCFLQICTAWIPVCHVFDAARAFSSPHVTVRCHNDNHTTLVDGYLGMSNDEERSEMRYVVRIAEFSESSNL